VHGRHPREDFAALADWLRARRILAPDRPWCVDVGANVGAPTLFFVRDMGRRVVAIEPVRDNADLLARNVERNGFAGQVRIVCAAVASEEGTVDVMRASHDGDSEVAADGVSGVELQSVRARRLDDIVAAEGIDPSAVAFVWSDTQGFETHVIRSGTSLWRARVPVFVEVWPQALERHGGVAAFLEAAREHFRSFVPARELTAGRALAEPRPIAELESFVRGLRKQTDCLLVT
jgi:FkbM family methyltransferase